MKRIHFILVCCCVFITVIARSQTVQPDRISVSTYGAKAEHETNYMRDSLGLSTSQIAQVDSVNKQYLKDIALLEGQTISGAERKQKMAEYKANRDEDLAEILSAAQLQRYKDLLKAQEDRMKARLQTY
jgi:septal ring factor EnvC (AmiA/AmiB activator)